MIIDLSIEATKSDDLISIELTAQGKEITKTLLLGSGLSDLIAQFDPRNFKGQTPPASFRRKVQVTGHIDPENEWITDNYTSELWPIDASTYPDDPDVAEQWIEDNVSNLATMKAALKVMAGEMAIHKKMLKGE